MSISTSAIEDEPRNWDIFPPEVMDLIFSFLPGNFLACTVRVLNKAMADRLRSCVTVRMSQEAPEDAFLWRWGDDPAAMRSLNLRQRLHLVCLTARSGSLANLKVAIELTGCLLVKDFFSAAAAGGHLEMCQWLICMACPYDSEAVRGAARAGHVAVVRWWLLREQAASHSASSSSPLHAGEGEGAAWTAAAGAGQRALCESLLADGCPLRSCKPLLAAARGGYVDLTFWLLQLPQLPNLDEHTHAQLLSHAAYGFELPALERLGLLLLTRCGDVLQPAAAGRWLRKQHSRAVVEALASPTPDWRAKVAWLEQAQLAASYWRLPQDADLQDADLQGVELQGVELQDADLQDVGLQGVELLQRPDCLERLRLLHAHGAERGACYAVAVAAISRGDLSVVRSLHGAWATGDALAVGLLALFSSGQACELAAAAGSLAVLRELLLARDCHMTADAVVAAARGGHLHVLQWLAGPEPPAAARAVVLQASSVQGLELAGAAAESGSLEVVVWLRERGCQRHKWVFSAGARSGSVELMEWMAREGCIMGHAGEAYLEAGRNGDLATLRCLRRLGRPWDAHGNTFTNAVYDSRKAAGVANGCDLAVLHWLAAEGCPVDWRRAGLRAALRTDPDARRVAAWVGGFASDDGPGGRAGKS